MLTTISIIYYNIGMKIYTGRHGSKLINPDKHIPIMISRGAPRFKTHYKLQGKIDILMPTKEELDCAGKSIEDICDLFCDRWDILGIEAIHAALIAHEQPGKDIVCLCFEDIEQELCHRRIFAEWYADVTGEVIEELS